VVVIGNDADTYGAITGSLLAAYHPNDIPKNWAQAITVYGEICELFIHIHERRENKENNNCLLM